MNGVYSLSECHWVSDPGGVPHTCRIANRTTAFRTFQSRRLSLPISRKVISKTTTIHISGLNTEPVFLLHSAPDLRYRFCLRISLLTCRLSFSQVGIGACLPHPLGNNIEFHEPTLNPNDLDLPWHDETIVMQFQ